MFDEHHAVDDDNVDDSDEGNLATQMESMSIRVVS